MTDIRRYLPPKVIIDFELAVNSKDIFPTLILIFIFFRRSFKEGWAAAEAAGASTLVLAVSSTPDLKTSPSSSANTSRPHTSVVTLLNQLVEWLIRWLSDSAVVKTPLIFCNLYICIRQSGFLL